MLTETTVVKLRARGIITEKYIGKSIIFFSQVALCKAEATTRQRATRKNKELPETETDDS